MRLAIAQRLTLEHGIRGGMEVQSHSLAEGLQARGHTPLILTAPHHDGRRCGNENGVPVRYVSPGSYRRYQRRWWAACYHELAQLHQAQPFDLLLSQSAGALGYLPRAADELHLPTVVVLHGTLMGGLRTQWRSARSPRGVYRLARLLTTLPGNIVLWRRAASSVDRWIAVSAEVAAAWQHEMNVPSEQITVVPNGVDTDLFQPNPLARSATRAVLGIAADVPLLLAVGRLVYEKGFHVAIAALHAVRARFPAAQLLIVGDGDYRPALEREAADLGDAVHFVGYVANRDLPAQFAAADVFLMPTLCDEAFPVTVVEALACGLPVIASDIGGIPSAIEPGRTGLLVPLGDAGALAQAVERVLRDSVLRDAMAAAARHSAVTRFSRARMIESIEQVLIDVIATRQKQ